MDMLAFVKSLNDAGTISPGIATKTEQIPGNKYSYGRDDVILAWTHTY